MCAPKPKMPSADQSKPKDPAIIRNKYLDGVDPKTRSMRTGRSSLRIPLGSSRGSAPTPGAAPVTPSPTAGPGTIPRLPPIAGGGGAVGVGGIRRISRR